MLKKYQEKLKISCWETISSKNFKNDNNNLLKRETIIP